MSVFNLILNQVNVAKLHLKSKRYGEDYLYLLQGEGLSTPRICRTPLNFMQKFENIQKIQENSENSKKFEKILKILKNFEKIRKFFKIFEKIREFCENFENSQEILRHIFLRSCTFVHFLIEK